MPCLMRSSPESMEMDATGAIARTVAARFAQDNWQSVGDATVRASPERGVYVPIDRRELTLHQVANS